MANVATADVAGSSTLTKKDNLKDKLKDATGAASTTAPTAPTAPTTPTTTTTTGDGTTPKEQRDPLDYGVDLTQYNDMYSRLLASTENGYQAKTPEQIRQEAENAVGSQYDAQRLADQQAADSARLALEQKLSGLDTSYQRERDSAAVNTRNAYANTSNQLLKRGMGRSSYGMNALRGVELSGQNQQAAINERQTTEEGNIRDQIASNETQLAQKLAMYDANQARDVQARIDALNDQEYQRNWNQQQANNSILANLMASSASMAQQDFANKLNLASANEQRYQFDNRNSGGGGSGTVVTPVPDVQNNNDANNSSNWLVNAANWLNGVNNATNAVANGASIGVAPTNTKNENILGTNTKKDLPEVRKNAAQIAASVMK